VKHTLIGLAALAVFGCAAVQTATIPKTDGRIVYRDLTKPKAMFYPVPKRPAEDLSQTQNIQDAPFIDSGPQSAQSVRCIEFGNDSVAQFDRQALLLFMAATPSDARILVVGHSHGQSAVGTQALASRRAETIGHHLQAKGFANVHTLAFWGSQTINFAPSRGVQLYVVPAGQDQFPIIFAKQKEIRDDSNPEIFRRVAARANPGGV